MKSYGLNSLINMNTLTLILGLLTAAGITAFTVLPMALTVLLGMSEYIDEFVFDGFDFTS